VSQQTATIEQRVWDALQDVMDPEIPAVSVVEMGMIDRVSADGDRVRVVVLPTFTGCPAISVILDDVRKAAASVPHVEEAVAVTSFDPPWTTERITEDGRRKLSEFGLAPPRSSGPVLITQIGLPEHAVCPYCGSGNTRNENPFGPTPCRALYYCESCRNPFEQFKEV
jgi:ring-1,2-phenylacetyl-CoA epoxidase subunit PaaD